MTTTRSGQFFAFVLAGSLIAASTAYADEPQFSPAPTQPQPQPTIVTPPASTPQPTPAVENLDVGWDTDWGMLFSLQNVFQNSDIFQGYGGGIGIQRNLDPGTTLRFGVLLLHSSNPAYVSESSVTTGGTTTTTKTFVAPTGPTSTLTLGLNLAFLKRFSRNALSAYGGVGAWFNYTSDSRNFVDDVSVMNQTTTEADGSSTIDVGVRGIIGADWRVAKSISIFLEYNLYIGIVVVTSSNTSTTVATASTTTVTTTSSSQTRIFDLSTNLAQGASIGVLAHF